ncbi:hypothetical protein SAMN06265218_12121 [Fodinibius sediminis]|uniref:Uncharacterized protein n=1 Tax=Fodinibius sediminis TaxID=1214077 RepID=A0A521F0L0_9BACT|nr:hypothetical protein SAMN06265218_12121 [Fodinibius sediminis]
MRVFLNLNAEPRVIVKRVKAYIRPKLQKEGYCCMTVLKEKEPAGTVILIINMVHLVFLPCIRMWQRLKLQWNQKM